MSKRVNEIKRRILEMLESEPLTGLEIARRLGIAYGTATSYLWQLGFDGKIIKPGVGQRSGYRLAAAIPAPVTALTVEVLPERALLPDEEMIRARISALEAARTQLQAHLTRLEEENRWLLHLEQLADERAELERNNAALLTRCQQLEADNAKLKAAPALTGLDYLKMLKAAGWRCSTCDNLAIPGSSPSACAKHINAEQKALFIGAAQIRAAA